MMDYWCCRTVSVCHNCGLTSLSGDHASFKREPDLQRDLIPVHLSTVYAAPNFSHFEPAEVSQRARCLGYCVLNRFRDALLRSSNDLNNLIDWIGHLHSPWIVFRRAVAKLLSCGWRRPEPLAFRSLIGNGATRTVVRADSAASYVLMQVLCQPRTLGVPRRPHSPDQFQSWLLPWVCRDQPGVRVPLPEIAGSSVTAGSYSVFQ